MMNILHVFFSFKQGGAELMLVDVMNEQVKNNNVSLIVINDLYSTEMIKKIDKRVKCYFINRKPKTKSVIKIIEFNLLIRRLSCEIIHCHDLNTIKLIYGVNAIKCVTLHNVRFDTSCLKKYHCVYAISQAVKKYISDNTGIDAPVIYNGIHPDEVIKKNEWSTNKIFRIVQIGRLDHRIKGQNLLIEAAYLLFKKGYKFEIDFIGEGPSHSFLQKKVCDYQIENEINFLGSVGRTELYKRLCNYDLLVQPSISEGFGISIVEAMAACVPVLVSNLPGPMEVIDGGRCGSFFEKGNIEDLADKIENIINLKINKTEAAYQRTCNLFDIKITTQRYLESYSNLLKI